MKKPKLPKNTDKYYFYLEPIYDHYRKVKVIDRCECCNHKIGEHFIEKGVKVIDWKVVKKKKDFRYHMNKYYEDIIADQIFNKNILLTAKLNKKDKFKIKNGSK